MKKTDMGGPSVWRAAEKGRRLVLLEPAQIDLIEKWLANGAKVDERAALAEKLAAAAERRVADYVSASADYWEARISEK